MKSGPLCITHIRTITDSVFFEKKSLEHLTNERDTKDLILRFCFSVSGVHTALLHSPSSHQIFFFFCSQLTFFCRLLSPSLSLLSPMLAHGSNKGKKNCNKSDSRTAHTALLSKPHSCTHKAVIKKTTQPEENKTKQKKNKAERLFNSPPLPPPLLP